MRNLLLLPALSLGSLAIAQGNQSWTATDINGTSHSIQSYLQDGKTVLVDLSAHWCGPCWAWHGSKIMDRLQHEFGPEGTNDLQILFIDASNNPPSTMNLLNGIGQTQGNWVEGANYPIIGPNGQGQLVGSNYNFPGYPTLFMHCPGASAGVEINRASTWQAFFASWRNTCGTPFNNGVNDATLLKLESTELCPGQAPTVELYNMGSATLTSARIEIRQGSTLLQTVNWTGNLPRWQSALVEVPGLNIGAGGTYTATVSLPNGQPDDHEPGNSEEYTYTIAPEAQLSTMHLELRTDNYAEETTWRLYDSNENVVAQNGALANATTYNYWWQLNPNECYRFEIYDSYGDGICCSYGQGYYRIRSNGVMVTEGGQFGGVDKAPFKTGTAVGIEENLLDRGLSLFPNPTTGLLNINLDLPGTTTVQFAVMNALGQTVHEQAQGFGPGAQQTVLDLSDLANGTYHLVIRSEDMVATRKVTLTR